MSWQTNTPTLFHHAANSQKRSDFAPIQCLLTAALTATEGRLMFPGRRLSNLTHTLVDHRGNNFNISHCHLSTRHFAETQTTRFHTCLDSDLLVQLLVLVLWCRIVLSHPSTAAAAAQGLLGYSRKAILTLLVENATCILKERPKLTAYLFY